MKTPDEIKMGLECCFNEYNLDFACGECPYDEAGSECGDLFDDALALIQQLEEKYARAMENAKILSDAVTKLERERDAAVREIPRECNTCKHFESCEKDEGCRFCSPTVDEECPCCDCIHARNWEWCGLLEV